jgi:hypothetical protein
MKKTKVTNTKRLIALLVGLALSIGVLTLSMSSGDDLQGRMSWRSGRSAPAVLSPLSDLSSLGTRDMLSDNVTRGELINTVVHGLLEPGEVLEDCNGSLFMDVPEDHKYCEEVAYAASHGIMNGYNTGEFGVDDTISKAQAATVVVRAFIGEPEITSDAPHFDDVSEESWYYYYIQALVDFEITANTSGDFNPNDYLQEYVLNYWMKQL